MFGFLGPGSVPSVRHNLMLVIAGGQGPGLDKMSCIVQEVFFDSSAGGLGRLAGDSGEERRVIMVNEPADVTRQLKSEP